mgnify:CR=1 FL=1
MRKIILISIIILSCKQINMEITSNSIGLYKWNQKIMKKNHEKKLEIILDDENKIKSIITRSSQYKTKEGFNVGTNLLSIEKQSKTKRRELKVSKGSFQIASLGKIITYNDISFVDENNDNKVDFVWIQRK